jgi:hypothetical protein
MNLKFMKRLSSAILISLAIVLLGSFVITYSKSTDGYGAYYTSRNIHLRKTAEPCLVELEKKLVKVETSDDSERQYHEVFRNLSHECQDTIEKFPRPTSILTTYE